MARIILSPKEIFEREFKHALRGYDKDEVDEFLDEIIKDYENFESQLQALRKENEELRSQLNTNSEKSYDSPNSAVSYKASEPEQVDVFSTSASNFDILKRISRLEKEVFGKQITE